MIPARADSQGAHILLSSSVSVQAMEERGRGNRGLGQASKTQPASSRGAEGETGHILQEWGTHEECAYPRRMGGQVCGLLDSWNRRLQRIPGMSGVCVQGERTPA